MTHIPPKYIQGRQISGFTMDGIIPISYECYRDDSREEIQKEINVNFTQDAFNKYLLMAERRQQNYYGFTDTWLYDALMKYPINNKSVCIFGSANPWYEAVAVSFKAKECVVFEHSDRPSFHSSICYKKNNNDSSHKFDVGFSISSFEHYGLGRYGDSIDPIGDFKIMQKAKKIIKKRGLLFLSVPVGRDFIHFNVGRIYGLKRLPKLIENWKLISAFGVVEESFGLEINTCHGNSYQPIFVLQNI